MADFQSVESLNNEAQAGWDAQQAEFRKAAAYNALRQQYGDAAGDPNAQATLQATQFNAQDQPARLNALQLANDATQQKTQFAAQEEPGVMERQGLDNQGQATTNAFNAGKVTDQTMATGQATGQQAHAILTTALSGLQQEANGVTDPQALGALWDKHAAAAGNLINPNADPAQTAQQLATEKAAFMQGGAAAVPKIQADLDSALAANTTPLDRAKIAETNAHSQLYQDQGAAATAKAAAAKSGAGNADQKTINDNVKTFKALHGSPEKFAAQIGAAQSFVDQKLTGVIGNEDEVQLGDDGSATHAGGLLATTIDLLNQVKGESASARLANSKIPGSTEFKLDAALHQLSDSAALTDLQTMRANGLSLGRVTNTEFSSASKAIINASIDADPTILRTQLTRLGGVYARLRTDQLGQIAGQQKDLDTYKGYLGGTIYGGGTGSTPSSAPAGQQPGVDPTTTNSIPGAPDPAQAGPAAAATGNQGQPQNGALPAQSPAQLTPQAILPGGTPQQQRDVTPQSMLPHDAVNPSFAGLPAPNLTVARGSAPVAAVYAGLQRPSPGGLPALSPALALATLGNWKQESEFRTSSVNDGEGAIGFDQWRGARAEGLKAEARSMGTSWTDPNAQIAYFKREISTGKDINGKTVLSPGQLRAGQQAMAATTVQEANAALKKYIAYGSPSNQGGENTRLSNAYGYAKMFHSGADLGQQLPSQGSPADNGPQQTASAAPAPGAQDSGLMANAPNTLAAQTQGSGQSVLQNTPQGTTAPAQPPGAQAIQAAQTPVALPSALQVPQSAVAPAAAAGEVKQTPGVISAHNILAKYGLKRK